MNFIKVKNFYSARDYQENDKPKEFKRKYLQITYLKMNLYAEYIENC